MERLKEAISKMKSLEERIQKEMDVSSFTRVSL